MGAGGASRAVLVGLQEAGVAEIVLVNRTRARAEELAVDLAEQDKPAVRTYSLNDLASIAIGANVIVNATSVGWHGDELPFDAGVLDTMDSNGVMVDLTYRETAVLTEARKRGLTVLDGLPMLIHQGARSFELWTGRTAPVVTMRAAVMDEQRRRAGAG